MNANELNDEESYAASLISSTQMICCATCGTITDVPKDVDPETVRCGECLCLLGDEGRDKPFKTLGVRHVD